MGEPSKPDWTYWLNMPDVKLGVAVELSVGADPGWFDEAASERFTPTDQVGLYREIATRIKIARAHARSGTLGTLQRSDPVREFPFTGNPYEVVNLADFRAWGESLASPFTFPAEFPEAAQPTGGALPATKLRCWPWGDYETELLRILAAAAAKFWTNYVPGEHDTAPNSADVAAWIETQRTSKGVVAKRVAEVMAQILRADGLPTGPR